jgi:uncharacterized protein YjbI with pentapeptide repeats
MLVGRREVVIMIRVEKADVDLRGRSVAAAARYGGTRFLGQVRCDGTRFVESADFSNCVFEQPVTFQGVRFERGVNFTNAVFRGGANFSFCRFRDRAYFWRVRFYGPADFTQALAYAGENAEPDFIFPGEANFSWTWFLDQATFRRMQFHGPAYFWRTLFFAGANFEECTFKAEAKFYGKPGDVQIARAEFSNPALLDALLARGVLAAEEEMFLQFDDRKQYLLFLFHDVGSEQELETRLQALQHPQLTPALVDELVTAWRRGARPMFGDPARVSWRGARFEKPLELEFLDVGLDILKLSRRSAGGPSGAGPGDIVLAPDEAKQLHDALLDAFDRSTLERVVYFGLQVRLEKIVPPGNLEDEVLDLVLWANENNKVTALLRAAIQENVANVALRQFAAYIQGKWPGAILPKNSIDI